MSSVRRLFAALVGMMGLRLGYASFRPIYVAWVLAMAASLFAYGQTFVWGALNPPAMRQAALVYVVAVWLFYYGGLSLVLGTGLRRRLVERLGEAGARRVFCAVLGVAFLNQALAQGAVMQSWSGSIVASVRWPLTGAAYTLILCGTGVKLWATYASSLDTYYYVDMLIGHPVAADDKPVTNGPFRWFRNPMYGVGNLHAYGSALVAMSWQGLLVAGIYHASLYTFYVLLERPFVARTYARAPR